MNYVNNQLYQIISIYDKSNSLDWKGDHLVWPNVHRTNHSMHIPMSSSSMPILPVTLWAGQLVHRIVHWWDMGELGVNIVQDNGDK